MMITLFIGLQPWGLALSGLSNPRSPQWTGVGFDGSCRFRAQAAAG